MLEIAPAILFVLLSALTFYVLMRCLGYPRQIANAPRKRPRKNNRPPYVRC